MPEFPPLDDAGLRAALAELAAFDGLLIAHAEDAAVIAAAPAPRAGRLRGLPGLAAGRGGGVGDRPADRGGARHRCPGARRPPGRRRCPAHAARARPRVCGSRSRPARTTSPSPPRRCPTARRRSSAARRSGRRSHREALWAALADGRHRSGGQRPLALHARPEAARRGDFGRPGAGSPRCRWPCPWCGRARGHRGIALTDVVRWMAAAPARLAGLPGEGRDRRRPGRRPGGLRARGALDRRRAPAPQPGHPLRGPGHCTASSGGPGCAASPPTASGLAAGCCAEACQSDPRDRLRPPARPRLARPRRCGRGRQRRVLRRAGEPRAARAAGGAHRVRAQGQGVRRLGDPRRRHSRATTGRSSGSGRRGSCAASSSTPPSSPATTRPGRRSTAPRSRATARSTSCSRPTGSRCCPLSGLAGNTHNSFPCRPTAGSPTSGSTSIPTAASPGCGCTAPRCPTPGWSTPARSTSPRWRTAGVVTGVSDEFYGRPQQLIAPGARPDHGRGLGDRPPAGRRQRLGRDRAGLRGRGHPRRARHLLLPAQRAGHRRRHRPGPRRRGPAAAAHPSAARHPAPVRPRRPRRRSSGCGSTSSPTAAWPGCGCGGGPPRPAGRRSAGAGSTRCPTSRPWRCSARSASRRSRPGGSSAPGRSATTSRRRSRPWSTARAERPRAAASSVGSRPSVRRLQEVPCPAARSSPFPSACSA